MPRTGIFCKSDVMSKGTNDEDTSDIEREFEEEVTEKEWPEEKELDPFAENFYKLSGRKLENETEMDNAINGIINEIERDYFFKGLFKKTKKAGQSLLQKGLKTFKGVSAFQAAKGITQLARGSLKGTLATLAKAGLKGAQGPTGAGAATLPVLNSLGFETGEEGNRGAWQNFTNVCKESFDYLARNLSEKADDPLEASKIASEAFGAAFKKVKSERLSVSKRRVEKGFGETSQKKVVNRTVAIALAMICILLVAALVAVIVVYKPMANTAALEAQLAEKDETISQLNNRTSALTSQLGYYMQLYQQYSNQSGTDVTELNALIANLNAQIATYENYLNLNASGVFLSNQAVSQAANSNTSYPFDIQFAGYVIVNVQSSSSTAYVEVLYSAFGVNYDEKQTVGTSGTAAFPLLPGTIEIRIGNTDPSGTVTGAVSATYYY